MCRQVEVSNDVVMQGMVEVEPPNWVEVCCHCGFDGHQGHWFIHGDMAGDYDAYCEECMEAGYHLQGDAVCGCGECQQELDALGDCCQCAYHADDGCDCDCHSVVEEDDIHCSQCNALTGTKNGAWAATCCSCEDITLCADCCPPAAPGDCHDGFCWSQAVEGAYPHRICLRCQED